jgi:hypothetical protein
MNEVREKISKQQEVKPKKIIDKEQIKRDIRALRLKDKSDEYKDIDVFDCMPSPENTLEYQKYLKVLREYQDAIPEQALPVTGKR